MPVKRPKSEKLKKLRQDKKKMWEIVKNHPCKAYRKKMMKEFDDAISKLGGDK